MAAARHRREKPHRASHLLRRVAVPAVLVTGASGVVVAAFAVSGSSAPSSQAVDLSAGAGAVASPLRDPANQHRLRAVSRSGARNVVAKPVTLQPRAVGHRYATANLNVWAAPREQGSRLGLINAGSKLEVTGQRAGRWAEVLVHGKDPHGHALTRVRWVNADYLAAKKPVPANSGGGTGSTATTGATGAT